MSRHIRLVLGLWLMLLALGCAETPTPEVYKSDFALREMPAFSPEHAPKNKKSPGDMPDLLPMWQPLNQVEASGPVRRREAETLNALELPEGLRLWMPTGEQTILRGYLYRLRGQQRYVCARAIKRAAQHSDTVKEALMAYGLPPELTALPLVLSTYETHGVSSRGASGLWQLTPGTAREYGLVVNNKVDERLDPAKATGAAARYLKHLHKRFSSWQIVILAYREGEGAVRNVVDASQAGSFEELAEFCRANKNGKAALSEQALQNVPKFVAALLVMTNSKAMGFAERDVLELAKPTRVEISNERESLPEQRKSNPSGILVDLPIN